MYTIGKFSMITRLSVKTLRHYHEIGLLVPDHVDDESGYRYYKEGAVERARVIVQLREMEFPLKEVQAILRDCTDDTDLVRFLEERRRLLQEKLEQYRRGRDALDTLLHGIKQGAVAVTTEGVREDELKEVLFLGVRHVGRWGEIGPLFGRVARKAGLRIAGPALSLCHDEEYRESDANYEAGFPVKREIKTPADSGLECRVLSGGPCVRLIHRGPYSEIGRSYQQAMRLLDEKGYDILRPTRESYIKGPGMILRGNPRKYVTEIQIMLK